jgi:pyrroline-5-carboxylate reductase
MGTALMRGLIAAGVYKPEHISAFDTDASRVQALADELGIHAASDAATLAQSTRCCLPSSRKW